MSDAVALPSFHPSPRTGTGSRLAIPGLARISPYGCSVSWTDEYICCNFLIPNYFHSLKLEATANNLRSHYSSNSGISNMFDFPNVQLSTSNLQFPTRRDAETMVPVGPTAPPPATKRLVPKAKTPKIDLRAISITTLDEEGGNLIDPNS